jgi:hypothetical protein
VCYRCLLQKLVAAYDKYAQDVGVIIPRGQKFEQVAKNNFPQVIQSNVQNINLNDMLAPGYPLNASKPNVAIPEQ